MRRLFSLVQSRLTSSTTLKSHSTLFLATLLMNFFNFIYHFCVGRFLGPASFGAFTALFSFFYLLNAFMLALQTVTAQYIGQAAVVNDTKAEALHLSRLFRLACFFALFFASLVVILSPFLARILSVRVRDLVLVALTLIPAILLPVGRGYLQGRHQFSRLGKSFITEGAVKFFSGLFFVFLGFDVTGALFGVTLGFLASLFLTPRHVITLLRRVRVSAELLRTFAHLLFYNVVLAMLFTFDMFLVRARASADVSGYYASLSLLGRIVFFATISVPQVIFAQSIHQRGQNKNTLDVLLKPLGFVVVFVLCSAVFFFIFGKLLVGTLLGSSYLPVAPLIPLVALSFGSISIASLICTYDLAYGRKRTTLLLFLVSLTELVIFSIVPAELPVFVISFFSIQAGAVLILFSVSFFSFVCSRKRRIRFFH